MTRALLAWRGLRSSPSEVADDQGAVFQVIQRLSPDE